VWNIQRSRGPDTVAMKITGHLTRAVFDYFGITSEADIREGLGKSREGQNTRTTRRMQAELLIR